MARVRSRDVRDPASQHGRAAGLNVRIQRERDAQFGRERALVEMRAEVVAAVGSPHVGLLGSLAVLEAVDEALAQIVAAGEHVGEPADVKALWIAYAQRRLIDELRSAEVRHRDGYEGRADASTAGPGADLPAPTEDGRELWRVREILSVLRGQERRWAEAWFDEILAGSRPAGTQPRGLPEKLGWSASKTKSVSRRARRKMATFIQDRVSGTVCAEQRILLDAFIGAGGPRGRQDFDGELQASTLVHVAGCEDCWTAWHVRRRSLLGRSSAAIFVPIDAIALAGHALAAKLTGAALGAHAQASGLLARLGIGGAAAAGGAGATLGGKATAVCVGVVCAATVGGEITGVLPAIVPERVHAGGEAAPRPERAQARADAATRAAQAAARKAAAPVAPASPTAAPPAAPGDLPPADAPPARAVAPAPPPPATDPAATFSASQPGAPLTPPPAASSASTSSPKCVPGDLGC
jgi:DNA-directed RNA polymerase specialized sigma24 family protein